eukprot:3493288-Pyramimonas_sp.AAC.1
MKIVRCWQHGIPQHRARLFLIACHGEWKHPFKWPKPVPLKRKLDEIIGASPHDNPKNLPPKEEGKAAMRRRQNVKRKYVEHLKNKVNPAK